ncbi:MAG: 4-hydroxy-tetrahydrodipicolinate reductase [Planctomycetota bacterium]|jgi:4-hydroxy-tetrahydrodipicolinate reductase
MPTTETVAPIRVAICGAQGRLGRHACELLNDNGSFEVVAALGRAESSEERLHASGASVGLDFTVAGQGAEQGLLMLSAGLRPVIGTSGVSLRENDVLDGAARELELGGLVVPNFSAGIWLLQRAAEEASRIFGHAEIIERHGPSKKDTPSGTALDTAERIALARAEDETGTTPIHSLRIPGLFSNQEVVFGGRGEVLRLVHETYGLDSFSAGILSSLRYASTAVGVGRGIGLAFEAFGIRP